MDTGSQRPSYDMKELRRQAGLWLYERRQGLGLTQRAFAVLVGVEPYPMVAQLEAGRGRIAPERYERWTQALGLSPAEFVRTIMRFYDPETHRLLFGASTPEETAVRLAFGKEEPEERPEAKSITEGDGTSRIK